MRSSLRNLYSLNSSFGFLKTWDCKKFIIGRNMATSSLHAKPVVGIISEYFLGDNSSLERLVELCPSASFVHIDHTGKKCKLYVVVLCSK